MAIGKSKTLEEFSSETTPPTLYVVATPIGALQDFSPHARQVLAEVDFVACEDTRHTGLLLANFGIKTPLASLHQHNEHGKSAALVERILSGTTRSAAVVTDAGTPAVSDPGAIFVARAHEAGVRVLSVPGPSALSAALGACGFLAPRVIFSAFFPREKKAQAAEMLVWLQAAPCAAVCYESPHRLIASVKEMAQFFPSAMELCVSREISKRFEEHIRGTFEHVLREIEKKDQIKGEIVVTVNVTAEAQQHYFSQYQTLHQADITLQEASNAGIKMSEEQGIPLKDACKVLAKKTKFSPKEIYAAAMDGKRNAP